VTGTAATAELLQQPLCYVVTTVAHELDELNVAEYDAFLSEVTDALSA
jgi:hypothetical protein